MGKMRIVIMYNASIYTQRLTCLLDEAYYLLNKYQNGQNLSLEFLEGNIPECKNDWPWWYFAWRVTIQFVCN